MAVFHVLNPTGLSWPTRNQLQASLRSLFILLFALCMLWLGHWLPDSFPKKIELREVALVLSAPPPPPPPPVQQQITEAPVDLQVQGVGVAIPLIKIKHTLDPIKPDIPAIKTQQSQWQSLTIDWNAFDLNQLDGLPNLLTPLRMTLPTSLSRKGIKRVLIKLDVLIDEQGQVTLLNIVENPHPELITQIKRLVRNSRFTAPTLDNQAVRARFVWPVEIEV